jgi:hypothetical protein
MISLSTVAFSYRLHLTRHHVTAVIFRAVVKICCVIDYNYMLQVLTLPLDILALENVASDVFHGCFVVTCTLFAFIGLVWLREQILHGGGPDWLERDNNNIPAAAGDILLPPAQPAPPDNNNVLEPQLQQGVDQVGEFILSPVDI